MEVFRICLEKYAAELRASGHAGRWNSEGMLLIYTAGSRALSCLENLVHRGGEGLNDRFRLLEINIPTSVRVLEIPESNLAENWREPSSYPACRIFGDAWIRDGHSCLLKVPSSLIPDEFNYLINPHHKDFRKVTIKKIQAFRFDGRLASS